MRRAQKIFWMLLVPCLPLVACGDDDDGGGGGISGAAGKGGASGAAGKGGSAGKGGTAGKGGSAGDGGSTGDGGSPQAGAGGAGEAPECDPAAQDNDTSLTTTRDDIGVRELLVPPTKAVRLAVDPVNDNILYMDLSGDIYLLNVGDGDTSTVTQLHDGSLIVGSTGMGCAVDPLDVVEHSFQGFAIGPQGQLFVVNNCINKTEQTGTAYIVRGEAIAGVGATAWTIVAETEPYPNSNTNFDHRFNGIVVSPDGAYVYVNSGSRTDHGEVQHAGGLFPDTREVPLTSAMFRLPADGDGILLQNDEDALADYLFADGLRNSFDPTFAPNGDLISGENGPDADYSEEINWLREGEHYGFPWRLGTQENAQTDPSYDPDTDMLLQRGVGFQSIDWTPEPGSGGSGGGGGAGGAGGVEIITGFYQNDPDFPASPGGFIDPMVNLGPDYLQIRNAQDGSIDDVEMGHTLTPHLSPLGMMFDYDNELCGEFNGSGLMLMFGAAGGTIGLEPSLAHLELTKDGDEYTARITKLVGGFNKAMDAVLVGNKVYVSDYGNWDPPPGPIYEITLPPSL